MSPTLLHSAALPVEDYKEKYDHAFTELSRYFLPENVVKRATTLVKEFENRGDDIRHWVLLEQYVMNQESFRNEVIYVWQKQQKKNA